ncbi:MAG: hypothetical protein JSS07_08460 [Proteobacteria bacterium]|nr:hypothetical protein [Pseudomonadota bacterium]
MTLGSEIVSVQQLDSNIIESMYGLFAKYYDSIDLTRFKADLFKKNYVVKITNGDSNLVGFSTLYHYRTTYQTQPLQILYSGDTIIADAYWGKSNLAFTWIKFAGKFKRTYPDMPLYWFVIVKGHRTYRYLPVFSKIFFPNYQTPTPAWEKGLIDQLALEKFGEHYNPQSGIVHYPTSQGHLKENWAQIPTSLLKRPEIQFFKSKNPGYDKGDELVCLCKLTEDNLKPFAKRLFTSNV